MIIEKPVPDREKYINNLKKCVKEIQEKQRKGREKYKNINPRWYYGSGLYDIMKNHGVLKRSEGNWWG